jgi:hypothetical protein
LPPAPEVEELREVVDGFGPDGRFACPTGPEITSRKYLPATVSNRGDNA